MDINLHTPQVQLASYTHSLIMNTCRSYIHTVYHMFPDHNEFVGAVEGHNVKFTTFCQFRLLWETIPMQDYS